MSQGGVTLPGRHVLPKGILHKQELPIRQSLEQQATKKKTTEKALQADFSKETKQKPHKAAELSKVNSMALPLRANAAPSQGPSHWGIAALGILALGSVAMTLFPTNAIASNGPLDLGHNAPVEQFEQPAALGKTTPSLQYPITSAQVSPLQPSPITSTGAIPPQPPPELAKLAQDNPWKALAQVSTYKNQPYAKGIIESVAQQNPGTILYHAPKFQDQPYASEVIRLAINQALAKEPWDVLEYSNLFKDQPYAATVIKRAVENAVVTYPGIVLKKADVFQKEPYAAAMVKKAADNALKKDPFSVLQHSSSFSKEPYAPLILQRAAERIPDFYLKDALKHTDQFNNQPYAGGIIRTLLDRLIPKRPDIILEYVDHFKTQPYALQYILAVAEKEPSGVIYSFNHFKDQPYAENVLKFLSTKKPGEILYEANRFKDQPYAATVLIMAAEKYPDAALTYVDRFKEQPYSALVIQKAVETLFAESSYQVLARFHDYKQYPFTPELIKRAAEKSPGIFLKFSYTLKDQPYAAPLIYQAAETTVQQEPRIVLQTALDLKEHHPDWKQLIRRAVEGSLVNKDYSDILNNANLFADEPYAKKTIAMAVDGALAKQYYHTILNNANRFADEPYAGQAIAMAAEKEPFTALATGHLFAGQPYAQGVIYKAIQSAVARQERGALLAYVHLVNRLHDKPDEIRFAAVKEATALELYTLMVFGEEELFTSSFNGFFNRLLTTMNTEHLQGDQFLEQAGPAKFRTFIKLCASYNRLNDFLQTMPPEAQTDVLTRFVKGVDKEKDPLSQAVAIADVFGIVNDPKMLKVFQDTIYTELKRVKQEKNRAGTVLYTLLSQMINSSTGNNNQWVANLDSRFKLQNLAEFSAKELFNSDGLQVQRQFFYNDQDGQNSFESFIAQYKQDPAWAIDSQDTFVRIHTRRNGRQIELFANRPDHEQDGQDAIDKIFRDRKIQPAMVVHRGHSYHAGKTISRIYKETRIVYLGSCGGYNNVAAVLERSPAAHILSTKSTGTMLVNDPLLKLINEEMLSKDLLNWGRVWADAEVKLGENPNFRNYMPPHKNLGVIFLKAYHHQMSKTGS